MARLILRIDEHGMSVARESRFDSEAQLHAAIAAHPEVLPTQDLNLGPLVALASELDLGAGPIDLLAVDPQGRLVIVEFKRGTENPDVREVVAQMLDYGSSLWRQSYEALETAVLRRLVEPTTSVLHLVEQRCIGLESAFDPDAFVAGVSDSLEQGNFVFLYVARDFDQRTRRVMTYLADGAQMTFFAVEVDHFVDARSSSAVLVPRTAFVPSWIASGATTASRRSTASAVDLATAAPAVRTLIERMDEVARQLALRVSDGRTGRNYTPPTREPEATAWSGVGVYATSRGAEFNLEVFRELGEDAVADDLLDRLRRVTGERVDARKWPSVSPESLLRDWDTTRRELIEPYFRARASHFASDDDPKSP